VEEEMASLQADVNREMIISGQAPKSENLALVALGQEIASLEGVPIHCPQSAMSDHKQFQAQSMQTWSHAPRQDATDAAILSTDAIGIDVASVDARQIAGCAKKNATDAGKGQKMPPQTHPPPRTAS